MARAAGRRVLQVEGDVVVPVQLASDKQEIGARSLRPRIAHLREKFLKPLRRARPLIAAGRLRLASEVDLDALPETLKALRVDRSVAPVAAFCGGHAAARRRLRQFVARGLRRYVAARASPGEPRVSMLSPYLHFGQISPVEIALAVRKASAPLAERDSWFTYYYWLDDERAPDFAQLVEIHRKPGYDPAELFMDPNDRTVKLKAALALARKKSGFRYMMSVVPLDPSPVRGSHGLLPASPADGPVLLCSDAASARTTIAATDVKQLLLDLALGGGVAA